MSRHAFLGSQLPVIQAPMAGVQGSAPAIAAGSAGGLGSLPCAMLSADAMRRELAAVRAGTDRAVDVNFFCHEPAPHDAVRQARWRQTLAPYFREAAGRADFSPLWCGQNWCGQNASGCRDAPAAELTRGLAAA